PPVPLVHSRVVRSLPGPQAGGGGHAGPPILDPTAEADGRHRRHRRSVGRHCRALRRPLVRELTEALSETTWSSRHVLPTRPSFAHPRWGYARERPGNVGTNMDDRQHEWDLLEQAHPATSK